MSFNMHSGLLLSALRCNKKPQDLIREIKACEKESCDILFLIGACVTVMQSPTLDIYLNDFRQRFMACRIKRINNYKALVCAGIKPTIFGIFLSNLEKKAADKNRDAWFSFGHETDLPSDLQNYYLDKCNAAYNAALNYQAEHLSRREQKAQKSFEYVAVDITNEEMADFFKKIHRKRT